MLSKKSCRTLFSKHLSAHKNRDICSSFCYQLGCHEFSVCLVLYFTGSQFSIRISSKWYQAKCPVKVCYKRQPYLQYHHKRYEVILMKYGFCYTFLTDINSSSFIFLLIKVICQLPPYFDWDGCEVCRYTTPLDFVWKLSSIPRHTEPLLIQDVLWSVIKKLLS